MTIKLPRGLPVAKRLRDEGIAILTRVFAFRVDRLVAIS